MNVMPNDTQPNGDGQLLVPEGWTDFMGACPDTCYVNCNYNVNGKSVDFKDSSYKYVSGLLRSCRRCNKKIIYLVVL
jgi:hypothetical protein